MTKSERYIQNILTSKVNHGKYIKFLCEQHENDLVKSKLYYFDADEANKYIRFIESLVFTQGKWAGKPFLLEDWQAFFISMMFGWKAKSTDLRRYKQVTLNVPKKNGKTELGAAIAVACAYLDKEERGQIFMSATSQDQAKICFDAAKAIVEKSKGLSSRFQILQHRLIVQKNQTYIRYISSELGQSEGKGASIVIFDEEHLQTDDELRDSLKSGMAAREQPLFISISTAGTNKNVPYYNHLKTCKKIVEGVLKNDSHLILIYGAPEGKKKAVDWEDPEVWKIANPNWGVSIIPENFIEEFLEAKNQPSKQPNFITKKLNIWADSSSTWIDSKKWEGLKSELKFEDFIGCDAYLGLDLGVTGDFSALSILIPKDGKMYLFMRFWIPEDMAEKRTKSDGLQFRQWAREGFISLTEGNATDYNVIENDIVRLSEEINIVSLSYDKAFASMLTTRLINDWAISCRPFGQNVGNVTGPTKQFYEWIMNETIQHDGNPVMAWMISNVEVYQDDANANYKIHKGRSKNKVDGPTATVNAIGDYMFDYQENYGETELIIV